MLVSCECVQGPAFPLNTCGFMDRFMDRTREEICLFTLCTTMMHARVEH